MNEIKPVNNDDPKPVKILGGKSKSPLGVNQDTKVLTSRDDMKRDKQTPQNND